MTVRGELLSVGGTHWGAVLGALVRELADTGSVDTFLPRLAEDFVTGAERVFVQQALPVHQILLRRPRCENAL